MRNSLKEPGKECCEKFFVGTLKDILDPFIQASESAARQAARAVSSSNFTFSQQTYLTLNVTQKHGRSHQCSV